VSATEDPTDSDEPTLEGGGQSEPQRGNAALAAAAERKPGNCMVVESGTAATASSGIDEITQVAVIEVTLLVTFMPLALLKVHTSPSG
jgi:hypothetical protein